MTISRASSGLSLRDLVASSIELVSAEQAATGAYPACPSFSAYSGFAWLRDGSFVAEGMSAHGVLDGPDAFHEWVAAVVMTRSDRIAAVVAALADGRPVDTAQYLPTRYLLDGSEGPAGWWDFQLDGYGTWLWAVERHVARGGRPGAAVGRAIGLVTEYLAAAWPIPCYDWWEEHNEHVHVSTLTAIEAGLRAAARSGLLAQPLAARASSRADTIAHLVAGEGSVDGRLRKWLGSPAVDASLLSAVAPFGVIAGGAAERTVGAVERDLLDGGGVHRFRADVFYGGGRWPVLAALLGQAYVRLGRLPDAVTELEWIAATATDAGWLPEQVSDRLLSPGDRQPWVERWGPVAEPLLWSHGQYLALAAELGVRR